MVTCAYQEDSNRRAGSVKKDHANAERDLAKITGQVGKIIDAIAEGMFHRSTKVTVDDLEVRKVALEAGNRRTNRRYFALIQAAHSSEAGRRPS